MDADTRARLDRIVEDLAAAMRSLAAAEERADKLEQESRKFYLADGSHVWCDTAADAVKLRLQAAAEIGALRTERDRLREENERLQDALDVAVATIARNEGGARRYDDVRAELLNRPECEGGGDA